MQSPAIAGDVTGPLPILLPLLFHHSAYPQLLLSFTPGLNQVAYLRVPAAALQ